MDLFFEAPWWYPNYVAYVKWNITKIEDYQPKPWPPPPKAEQKAPEHEVDKGAEEFAPEIIKKKKEEQEKQKKESKKKRKGKKKKKKKRKKKENEEGEKEEKEEDKKETKEKKRPKIGHPNFSF